MSQAHGSPFLHCYLPRLAFTSEYSGVFGISRAPDGTISDEGFKCFRKGRNYLCAAGPNGTLYWILMFKNKEKLQGTAIRRYTEQDLDRLLDLARDDIVKPGISFGDIFDRRIRASIVPIEEGILEQCFYKRVVLLGDSWHKVNNISGWQRLCIESMLTTTTLGQSIRWTRGKYCYPICRYSSQ